MTATQTAPTTPKTAAKPAATNLSPTAGERRDYASQLRQLTIACRVRRDKLGVRKAMSREQLKDVATYFDADSKALSAAKRLLDTRDPAFRAVVRVMSQAVSYWKAMTAPYPEPGTRLIRKDLVEMFNTRMKQYQDELEPAAEALQAKYGELRERAREQLGNLFNPADYPARIDLEFGIHWDFPSIEPPEYLKQLHPQLYAHECERIKGRFEEAVRLTEQALLTKLHEMVAHLSERLSGDVDGKSKVFRDSAIANLNGFFEQFRTLNLGSNVDMQRLVDQAQNLVKGVSAEDLRGSNDLRSKVADGLSAIGKELDGMMINKPGRKIDLEDETELFPEGKP